ncbi:hypothetical protein ASO14_2818 [Kurthia sp. 11kri321]|nr:hypothetical protein ASO14_2818 [Kurthia sp. 11kri321]
MTNQLFQTDAFPMTKDAFFYRYKRQTQQEVHHILLESGRGGKQSIAAWNPLAIISSQDNGIRIDWRDGSVEERVGESLHLIEELTKEYAVTSNSEFFTGGVMGTVSYDYTRKIEKLAETAEADVRLPDQYMYLVDAWAVYDEANQNVTLMKTSTSKVDLEKWQEEWEVEGSERIFSADTLSVQHQMEPRDVSMTGEQFEQAVRKIQEYIAQGDVFQVNLSVRQSKEFTTDAIVLYEALRTFNPSPYMAFIQSPDFAIVSGSPELLVKKEGTALSTRPIAGTRPRGANDAEDLALANELIEHPKERAEHVMLVDLERNDLGKVSAYGTVHVDEFMVIEKYSHVQHIVSNVRSELDPSKSNADVVRAMFPGGTITGAPKIRTMEIIEELEPVRRGIYTGSIGWMGYNGDLDFNIVIRTAFIQDERVHIQAGAGIVIDSIPEKEYEESLNKAKSMWQAVQMVEELTK